MTWVSRTQSSSGQDEGAEIMAVTFHGFPLLPKELREHIWDMASYPGSRPGAHVFKVVEEHGGFRLVPVGWQQRHHGKDRSGYFPNGGLWTACTESRARIQRYTKAERPISAFDHLYKPNLCQNPVVLPFRQSDGGRQNCVLYPGRDLFCIRPHGFDALENRWGDLLDRFVDGADTCCRFGIRNLALEIDESFRLPVSVDVNCVWGAAGDGGLLGSVARAMVNLPNRRIHKLWVIDYRLRPKTTTSRPSVVERHLGHRVEPQVFQGADRKFVEVRGDEWETQVVPCEDGTTKSVFNFTNQLDLIMKGRYTDQDSHDWSEVWETGCPALGILACVPNS
jgi:hypothetical protein